MASGKTTVRIRKQTPKVPAEQSPLLNICLTPGCFVPNHDDLKRLIHQYRNIGKRIVLTQGVYDLIHVGHALYLSKARLLGDILIVGLDSDELTRVRKGPRRPIVPQEERVEMLLHLRHVDVVTMREVEHGIGGLIELVRPDVFVASESTKDFSREQQLEYERCCGKVVIFPPQATTSSTNRMRQLAIDGAEELATEVERLTSTFLERIRKA
ncbi:MAG: hypothetical protein COV10_04705 [Candidatus Vogelbacteria bacterium CG10_big_fil_rev_8_21_14_0_10_51_16]|uniref:Cytidyltransferase-like domain-containing protein n=1 Tax=Candidatus Vogelbacteria bacterium CG10_big_fil_rev_8_21_14_0_10_51_16 TaxID=1975045 RepID=A0A2H0RD91_9BACT|nr:MAG: hypothetical protein COV10_04705 [Candidatus Vogelbacteria bacterium CG10_big_fil_rev_8_21_14_0_10_51_16]